MVPELVLALPMAIGADPPGQGPGSFSSEAGLESGGSDPPEHGQGPIECVHTHQILLPPFDVITPVAVQC